MYANAQYSVPSASCVLPLTQIGQQNPDAIAFLCAMPKADIYIFGDIYNEQADFVSEWGIVSLSQVVKQVNQARESGADELCVRIHSRGGDVTEGFAIHDFLKNSGLKVTTLIEGLCASIATVIALAGADRQMTSNSEFFIHNPWGDPFAMSGFTADDYEKRAEEIRQAENKLLDFYVAKTGADRELLSSYMKEETSLTADQALELKFITGVVNTINARASLGQPKTQFKDMKETNKLKLAMQRISAFLDGKTDKVVALDLTLEDGTAIVVETEEAEPKVGDAVTVNGEPAPDGEHKLPDGTILVTAGGKITEIKKADAAAEGGEGAEGTDDANAQVEQLTAANAQLQAQLDAANASVQTLTTENQTLRTDVDALTASIAEIQNKMKGLSSNFRTGGRNDASNRTQESKKEDGTIDVSARIEARKKQLADQNSAK